MEDLEATTPPESPLPQGNADPDDPLRPEIDENEGATPPVADPSADMDVTEDGPDAQADAIDDEDSDDAAREDDDKDSDAESVLSEIDEAQFADFDPAAIAIEERPVAIDETNVHQLQSHKRKRVEGEEGAEKRKKKKEGRREKKPKRRKNRDDEDDDFTGGDTIEGKRVRKRKEGLPEDEDGLGATANAIRKEKPRHSQKQAENEAELTPEERRKRALDRKINDALRDPSRRQRRRGGIDLEAVADDQIENIRLRMGNACTKDAEARAEIPPQPATHKLAMLPEVATLLNRNTLRDQIVDPDTNLLQAVRFFLEPLQDGSLPAYDIQRELFSALARLPIGKDALIASGIGKVTLFYTKSRRPEQSIKRIAERLLGEWTRPILKRTDDYRKREFQSMQYDPLDKSGAQMRGVGGRAGAAGAEDAAEAARRERLLALPSNSNRARAVAQVGSYTIAPQSTVFADESAARRGRAADEVFKRITNRPAGVSSGAGARR